MLAALDRKAVRNLLQMKGQFLAIALVIACGVAAFVMSLSTLSTLNGIRPSITPATGLRISSPVSPAPR